MALYDLSKYADEYDCKIKSYDSKKLKRLSITSLGIICSTNHEEDRLCKGINIIIPMWETRTDSLGIPKFQPTE